MAQLLKRMNYEVRVAKLPDSYLPLDQVIGLLGPERLIYCTDIFLDDFFYKYANIDQIKKFPEHFFDSVKKCQKYIGISTDTMGRRKVSDKSFAECINRGKAKGIAQVAKNLFQQSAAGNVSAGIFYLKNRAGWKDKQEVENTAKVTIIEMEHDEDI